jgi:sortase B
VGKVSTRHSRGLPRGRNARAGSPLAGAAEVTLAVFALAALSVGLCFAIPGASGLSEDIAVELRYSALAEETGKDAGATSHVLPDGAAAWLTVGGTSIDYPVAQASAEAPEFYLSHDLWGNDASAGCPYLDHRCDASATRALVYAHRLGTTGKQFSPIAGTWRQVEFDKVGALVWTTPDGTESFRPLCALRVDKTYQPIQSFGEQSAEEFRSWLAGLLADSSAQTTDAAGLAARAKKEITLVTCSSEQSGQRDRTLLVFVATS